MTQAPTLMITQVAQLYFRIEQEGKHPEISPKQVPTKKGTLGHTQQAREKLKQFKVGELDQNSVPLDW